MKTRLLLLMLVASFALIGAMPTAAPAPTRALAPALPFSLANQLAVPTATYYVCNGSSAYAYHGQSNCSGLQRCRGTISTVTAPPAGRSACRICIR